MLEGEDRQKYLGKQKKDVGELSYDLFAVRVGFHPKTAMFDFRLNTRHDNEDERI